MFSGINDIGHLYDCHENIPFIVHTIEVDGKSYTGFVNGIKLVSGGDIEYGDFHPHLDFDYFESFKIYPNSFIVKKIIDLESNNPENSPYQSIMFGATILNLMNKNDYGLIRKAIPQALELIFEKIQEYHTEHPKMDCATSLRIIYELTQRCEKYNKANIDKVDEKEHEQIMKYIQEDLLQAIAHLSFEENA